MTIKELYQRRIDEVNLYIENYNNMIDFKQKQKRTYQSYVRAANVTIWDLEKKIDKLKHEKEELENRITKEGEKNNG